MKNSLSERRMIENEVVFRQYNERIKKGFDRIKQIAQEDKQEHLLVEHNLQLSFYCECCDNDCKQRIKLMQRRYTEIHKKRDRFIVIPGHQNTDIERVVSTHRTYCVVEKYVMPPATATTLHQVDTTSV